MFIVSNKATKTTPLTLLLTLSIFHTLVSIVNFEHVIAGWAFIGLAVVKSSDVANQFS